MKFLSVCSGIEAASAAWGPLGWEAVAFSEIEPFPSGVLAYRYPHVPNLGDMTKFNEWPKRCECADHSHFKPITITLGNITLKIYGCEKCGGIRIDVLVGGTPCQSFSLAGLRKGLADPRGNLCLTFLAIAARYRPRWVVWENVPGVHSSWSDVQANSSPECELAREIIRSAREAAAVLGAEFAGILGDGAFEQATQSSDFDCFLAGLENLGYGVATRIFDAQFFGLAQRRERVFVVGCLGNWQGAAAVLFERAGLRGDPTPSRKARKGVAGTLSSRASGGGGLGTDFDLSGGLQFERRDGGVIPDIADCLQERDSKGPDSNTKNGHLIPEVSPTLGKESFSPTKSSSGQMADFCITQAKSFNWQSGGDCRGLELTDISQPLTKEQTPAVLHLNGTDVQDGKGIANPVTSGNAKQADTVVAFNTTQLTHPENRSNPKPGDPAPTLAKSAHPPTIAFSAKDSGADAGNEIAPTLRSGGHAESHANGGVMPAVAFKPSHFTRGKDGAPSEVSAPLSAEADKGDQDQVVQAEFAVRRLTPRECERLQGFPDDFTLIPWRGAPAEECPDGPRYKALGNSMPVPVMRKIGQRIAAVDKLVFPKS